MRSYFKSAPSKSSALIIISVEGKREKKYFTRLRNLMRLKVDIEILYDKDKSAPPHVLNRAKEIHAKYSSVKSSEDLEKDQFWLVLDRDSWTQEQLDQITGQCSENDGWFHAISNPCFEVWVLLHFSNIEIPATHSKTSLNELLVNNVAGGYKSSSVTLENLKQAIQRAKEMDIDNGTPVPNHPGTRVYLLAEEFVHLLSNR